MSFRGITPLTTDIPVANNPSQTEAGQGSPGGAMTNLGQAAPEVIIHSGLAPADQEIIEHRLLEACRFGNCRLIKELLDKGANVNCTEVLGYTPLHRAVSGCKFEAVKLLLASGANPNAEDRFGLTPLARAARTNSNAIIKALLKHGAICGAALVECIRLSSDEQDMQTMQLLLDSGANIDAKNRVGRSALSSACSESKTPIVQFLLDKGADPGVNFGKDMLSEPSPLFHAVTRDRWDVVALLLMHAKGIGFDGRGPLAPIKLLSPCAPHLRHQFSKSLRNNDRDGARRCIDALACFLPAPQAAFLLTEWIGLMPVNIFWSRGFLAPLNHYLFMQEYRGKSAYSPAKVTETFECCKDQLAKHFVAAMAARDYGLALVYVRIAKALILDRRAASMLAEWYPKTIGTGALELTKAIYDGLRKYIDDVDDETKLPDDVLRFALDEHSRQEIDRTLSFFGYHGLVPNYDGKTVWFSQKADYPGNPTFAWRRHGLETVRFARLWALNPYQDNDHWLAILDFLAENTLDANRSEESRQLLEAVGDLYLELERNPLPEIRDRAQKLSAFIAKVDAYW